MRMGHYRAFFDLEYPIICNADIFSAVAESQKWALIGELGLVGRLNRFTDNYEFCHVSTERDRRPDHEACDAADPGKKSAKATS